MTCKVVAKLHIMFLVLSVDWKPYQPNLDPWIDFISINNSEVGKTNNLSEQQSNTIWHIIKCCCQ